MQRILSAVGILIFSVALLNAQAPPRTSIGASLPNGFSITMPSIDQRRLPTFGAGSQVDAGKVEIETVVNEAGLVAQARVARSSDRSGALDRACLDALRQWRFRPAANNGRPVASLVLVTFSVSQPDSSGAAVVDASLGQVESTPAPQEWQAAREQPGGGVQFPSVIREVRPNYTPEAMRAKIQGTVTLEVVVAADGTVGSAKVTRSLDSDHGLDRAALVAARYWLFTPGTKGGVPVATIVTLMLEFRLH